VADTNCDKKNDLDVNFCVHPLMINIAMQNNLDVNFFNQNFVLVTNLQQVIYLYHHLNSEKISIDSSIQDRFF
jgi:hypothetical protein